MPNDRRLFAFNSQEKKSLAIIFLLSALPVVVIAGFFLSIFGDLVYTYMGSTMADQFLRQYLALTLIMLVYNFIFVALVAYYFVHKLYGPLPRILKYMDEIIAGRSTSRIYLRKGDFSGELIGRINALIDKLPKQ